MSDPSSSSLLKYRAELLGFLPTLSSSFRLLSMGEAGEKKAEEGGERGEKRKEEGEVAKKKEEDKDKDKDKDKKKQAEGEGKRKEGEPGEKKDPDEIVMRVYMHCEGCARSVRRALKGIQGVEEVKTDCHAHKVVVKGAAHPLMVVDRVQRKSGRKAELLSPLPKPEKEDKEKPSTAEKKDDGKPQAVSVVLKVQMHCEACSLEIKRRILRMKGVEAAETDVKKSLVKVKGTFEPGKLLEHVYKRTGKHAVVVKAESEKSEEAKKKDDGGTEKRDAGEVSVNPFQQFSQRYPTEYAYPPQIFSDDNPNACAVM
ncbi:heavy metal-associated isoprenylated plant protein 8-like [Wolffia australiana]